MSARATCVATKHVFIFSLSTHLKLFWFAGEAESKNDPLFERAEQRVPAGAQEPQGGHPTHTQVDDAPETPADYFRYVELVSHLLPFSRVSRLTQD